MPTLYSAALWVNKDKPDEHVRMIQHFHTKEEAETFLSQVDSTNYIILELDADEWLKYLESIKGKSK